MPTTYIKKLSAQGKGSLKDLESKWKKAKSIAKEEGKEEDFAYITGIFKNMIGEGFEVN